MEILVIGILSFMFGMWLGSLIKGLTQAMAFYEIMKQLGITQQQLRDLAQKEGIEPLEAAGEKPAAGPEIEVRLEQHGGQIYAYRRDNSQFLAQGTDRDTLIDHLNQTFAQGARLIIREEDGAAIMK